MISNSLPFQLFIHEYLFHGRILDEFDNNISNTMVYLNMIENADEH